MSCNYIVQSCKNVSTAFCNSPIFLSYNHLYFDGLFFSLRVHSLAQLSESSDVYSFGVFLLELITGKEAASLISSEPREPLVHWVMHIFSVSFSNSFIQYDSSKY